MATIEERARDYAVNVTVDELNKDGLDSESFCGILHGYVKGATDQKKIDIIRMRQWLEREYAYNGSMAVITPDMIDEFCKAMEE